MKKEGKGTERGIPGDNLGPDEMGAVGKEGRLDLKVLCWTRRPHISIIRESEHKRTDQKRDRTKGNRHCRIISEENCG